MLSELYQKRLKDGLANSDKTIQLVVHPISGNDKANQALADVARQFEIASEGKITVLPGDGKGPSGLPAISLRCADRSNIKGLRMSTSSCVSPGKPTAQTSTPVVGAT